MKKPRKPKLSKYPKTPKKSASLQTKKNFLRRCDEVDKRNREKAAIYNKKLAEISQSKKMNDIISARKRKGIKQVHLKVA